MFFKVVVVLATIAAAGARTTWKDLAEYNFEKYVAEFQHPWAKGTTEYNSRKKIFDEELARVRGHNVANLSWKEGVNKFSAMTVSEKKVVFTYLSLDAYWV